MAASQWFDIIVIGLIVLFGLKYLASGIIRELFGLAGIIGGIYLAVRYKTEAGTWISQNVYDLTQNGTISPDGTIALAGFLAVLFGVWIACLILGEILSKLFKLSGLGFIDKLGGMIFGVAKIFLILAVIATLTHSSALLNKQTKPFVEDSKVYPYLLKFGEMIVGNINFGSSESEDELEKLEEKFNDFKDDAKAYLEGNSSKTDANSTDANATENLDTNDSNSSANRVIVRR